MPVADVHSVSEGGKRRDTGPRIQTIKCCRLSGLFCPKVTLCAEECCAVIVARLSAGLSSVAAWTGTRASSHADRSFIRRETSAVCMAWPARSATTSPSMRRPASARSPIRSSTLCRTYSSVKRSGPFSARLAEDDRVLWAGAANQAHIAQLLLVGLVAEGARRGDEVPYISAARSRWSPAGRWARGNRWCTRCDSRCRDRRR